MCYAAGMSPLSKLLWDAFDPRSKDISHSLNVRDIDTDSEWMSVYTECLTVIVINAIERAGMSIPRAFASGFASEDSRVS